MEEQREFLDTEEWLNQGKKLLEAGDSEGAEPYFDRILKKNPMHQDAYLYKGIVKADQGKLEEAQELFVKASMIDRKQPEPYFHLGNIAFMRNSYTDSIKNYNKAIALGYDQPDVYFHRGMVFEETEEFEEAIRSYNKAIQMDELTPDYRVRKATVYLMSARYEEALQTLEELRMVAPDHIDCYHLASAAYMAQGKFDEAEAILSKGEELFPADRELFFDRLRVLNAKGDISRALEYVEQAGKMELNEEERQEVYLARGKLLGQTGDLDGAMESFEAAYAIRLDGQEDGESLYFLMNACLAKGDYEKLLEYAKKAEPSSQANPYTLCSKYYQALSLGRLKKTEAREAYKEAIRFYRRISMENPDRVEAYLFRAMCHKDLKEYDKAMELLDYVGRLQPQNGNLHVIRGNLLKEQGKQREAEKEFALARKAHAIIPGEV